MKIYYNIAAMQANNALAQNDTNLSKSIQRLSSGLQINSAQDNPSGLAMAKRMRAQIDGLERANRNSQDGVSLINIADGALGDVEEMLQRMNELAIQAANGTLSDSDRGAIQDEVDQLKEEITRIAKETEFNSQVLMDGTFDLKGYTNNLTTKVVSYSDTVPTDVYKLESLTVNFDEKRRIASAEKTSAQLGDEYKIEASSDNTVTITGNNEFSISLELPLPDKLEAIDPAAMAAPVVTGPTTTTDTPTVETTTEAVSTGTLTTTRETTPTTTTRTETYTLTGTGYSGTYIRTYTTYTEVIETTEEITVTEDNPLDPSNPITRVVSQNVTRTVNEKEIVEETYQLTNSNEGSEGVYNMHTVTTKSTTDKGGLSEKTEETVEGSGTYTLTDLKVDITNLGAMRLQVGANEKQVINVRIPKVSLETLGIHDMDMMTKENATEAITKISGAIEYISAERSRLGAYQNRLESNIANLDVSTENMTSAYSRIMDVDMAEEMTQYSTYQVLSQTSTSMLAQANERPSQVLQILQ